MQKIIETVPDISGKCVSIKTRGSDLESIEIDNPIFESQLGRIFITGTSPIGSTESGWLDGKGVSVAWDQVSEYYVFESAHVFSQSAEEVRSFYKSKLS